MTVAAIRAGLDRLRDRISAEVNRARLYRLIARYEAGCALAEIIEDVDAFLARTQPLDPRD